MAKGKRVVHFTTGPKEIAHPGGLYRFLSACGFAQRWSHNESKTWDALTTDPDEVTCVHCKREM